MRQLYTAIGLGLLIGCKSVGLHAGDAHVRGGQSNADLQPGAGDAMASAKEQEPRRFELKEGVPVPIGYGITLTLKDCMYAHAKGGVNLSMMRLRLVRDGREEDVTLELVSPGPQSFLSTNGVRLAIGYVDPYHQPSTGAVLVLPP